MKDQLRKAQMVMTPRGVGMIVRVQRRVLVKFGADGPHWNFWVKRDSIRHATRAEIEEAGLGAVGRESSRVDDTYSERD